MEPVKHFLEKTFFQAEVYNNTLALVLCTVEQIIMFIKSGDRPLFSIAYILFACPIRIGINVSNIAYHYKVLESKIVLKINNCENQ